MDYQLITKANNIWKRAASQTQPDRLSFEVEFYKKFLNLFHVGNYFYSIFSYARNEFDLVDVQLEKVLGYSINEYDVPFLISCIHPDDVPYFLNFENRAMDFLTTLPVDDLVNYKVLHDYRVRKADGNYVRLLQQGIVLEHDEHGGILRTLIVHTDITHIKTEGRPVLSFIGLNGRQSFTNVETKRLIMMPTEVVTKREKEVLSLMTKGKLSKEIAIELKISKLTVDRHRKNILAKTSSNTTSELITKAIQNGWV